MSSETEDARNECRLLACARRFSCNGYAPFTCPSGGSPAECLAHIVASPAGFAARRVRNMPRTDLRPNVCAVYTEPDARGRGIAGALLHTAAADMRRRGVRTLYLLTDHTGFYERYGWEFLCLVTPEGASAPSRMYMHREPRA